MDCFADHDSIHSGDETEAPAPSTHVRSPMERLPRVDVVFSVNTETAEELYGLYHDAFEPLRIKAAARQVLRRDEFMAEMLDRRVTKYVVRINGLAVGLSTLTQDLETLPWIEPAFYAARYPEQHARNAIFYQGITLVHPDHQGSRVFAALMFEMVKVVGAARGIAALDICSYNESFRSLHETALTGSRRLFPSTLSQADRQTYYVIDMDHQGSAAGLQSRTQ